MIRIVLLFVSFLFAFNVFAQTVSLDTAFNSGTAFNDWTYALALQDDGKILVGGDFTSYNGTAAVRFTRLLPDGALDNAFDAGALNNSVRAIAVQPDGRIVIAGAFTSVDGVTRNCIARLNANGTVDTSFDPGTGFNFVVRAVKLQSDGKIIAGGDFTTFNGASRKYIARLNDNGSLDTTFDPGDGFNNNVYALARQSDAKVIAAGAFGLFDGVARNRIARLEEDGSLDVTFNPGTGVNSGLNTGNIYALAIDTADRIVAGGSFSSFNGVARNSIVRLLSNGLVDTAFDPEAGFAGAAADVRSLLIDPSSRIVAAGSFAQYNGTAANNIVRIHPGGAADVSFDAGAGFDNYVYAVKRQSDAKLIVGGAFTSFDGTPRNRIVRLIACASSSSTMSQTACNDFTLNGQTYTASGTYHQTLTNADGCDSVITLDLIVNNVDAVVTQVGNTLSVDVPIASYQWVDCGNQFSPIANETAQTFAPSANGNYAAIVTSSGCVDTSACLAFVAVGASDVEFARAIQAFPNPASDQINLVTDQNLSGAILRVMTPAGNIVLETHMDRSSGYDINICDLPQGLYFVEIVRSNEAARLRVIKQ
ncbi:MAG TPA: T9SS type A sorting domain-containing protein [Chitinophagales bacterium]|nr:T9SS type A sorting domain-containing protein [Chitinophagales bacterium]